MLVLTAGKMPPNPSELLGSNKMQALVDELEEWADWVIIDSPPLLAVADPASVARWADGVLLVMQAGKSTREASKKSVELLGKVGSHLVGVAVWGYEEGKTGGYGYGYGYHAGGHYYTGYYESPNRSRSSRSNAATNTAKLSDVDAEWNRTVPAGQKAAVYIGRLLAAAFGLVVTFTLLLVVVYVLDAYFAWGIADSLASALGH